MNEETCDSAKAEPSRLELCRSLAGPVKPMMNEYKHTLQFTRIPIMGASD